MTAGPAVRYMEYPVLTGVYQYLSMALAKDLHHVQQADRAAGRCRGGGLFSMSPRSGLAFGVVGDAVGDRRACRGGGCGTRPLVGASPLVIFQIFTNFDALGNGFGGRRGCWRGRDGDRCWPGC